MSQNLDFSKFTKDQLKDQLRARNLKLGGNKPELIARLQAAITGVPEVVTVQSVLAGPIGLPLVPVASAGKGRGAPKKPVKTPAETVTAAIKESGLSLEASLSALLAVYGLQEFLSVVVESLGGNATIAPAAPLPETYEALKEMKVEDLKKILKSRNEKVGGKKEELIQRILIPTPQTASGQVVPSDFALPPIPPMIQPLPVTSPLPTVPGLPVQNLPTVPGLPVVQNLPTSPRTGVTLPMLPVADSPKF